MITQYLTGHLPPAARFHRTMAGILLLAASCFLAIVLQGCGKAEPAEVVLYTSVDQPYAAPIVQEFTRQTGIKVRLVTDTEATKSIGLADRLRAEKGRPRADAWWGNEPFNTVTLAQEGLLQPYESPMTSDITPMYVDPDHRWAGNGLRARVVAVSDAYKLPTDKLDLSFLAIGVLKGKLVMANPRAGTTMGHVAALYSIWGQARADVYFKALYANEIKLVGGNGPSAEAVGKTAALMGLTDNDDVDAMIREGGKLKAVLPDQGEGGLGTLMLPTTVGLVAGSPQPEGAKKLIDYLLSPAVEKELIRLKFAGWSVRGQHEVKAMNVDYREVARIMPQAGARAEGLLQGRE